MNRLFLKFSTILIIIYTLNGCNKKNQANSTSTAPITNSSNSLSNDEQSLVGKWILRKKVNYNGNGTELSYTNYYDTSSYFIEFKSSIYPSAPISSVNSYDCINGLNGMILNSYWNITSPNSVSVGLLFYQITFKSSDSLTILFSGANGMKFVYCLNKTVFKCTQSQMEKLIAKNWVISKMELLNSNTQQSYNNPALYYANFNNVWDVQYSGWICKIGLPLGNNLQQTWQVVNNNILYLGLKYYKIDSITNSTFIIRDTISNTRYYLNP